MSKKEDIKKQAQQIANGEAVSASKALPGNASHQQPQQAPGPSVTSSESALDRALAAVNAIAERNASQAEYLGKKLAESEQAFPLVMLESYQRRTAELRGAGLDAESFLARLEGEARRMDERIITVALPQLSNPSPLQALPQRAGAESHD